MQTDIEPSFIYKSKNIQTENGIRTIHFMATALIEVSPSLINVR